MHVTSLDTCTYCVPVRSIAVTYTSDTQVVLDGSKWGPGVPILPGVQNFMTPGY